MATAVPSILGLRCGAYLIDVITAILIAVVFGWVPLIGSMFAGVLMVAYWLFRDINGASPGKMLLCLRVVSQDGSESTTRQRILRNVTLIIGPALFAFPLVGVLAGPMAGGCVLMLEIACLIIRRQRLGDMLADTDVVHK
jgi:uncharacterized RDD family membrane protein YckC